jgi:hypothetical protein
MRMMNDPIIQYWWWRRTTRRCFGDDLRVFFEKIIDHIRYLSDVATQWPKPAGASFFAFAVGAKALDEVAIDAVPFSDSQRETKIAQTTANSRASDENDASTMPLYDP